MSSPSLEFEYGVFLSFRGKDTRYSIAGNLTNALKDKRIPTFFDDRELIRGGEETVTPELVQAIEKSKIVILVFSANYAAYSFCLDELLEILDRVKGKDRLVLPVFYGVDPSQVRDQTGSYGEAMANHEKRFNDDIVLQWRKALEQAANSAHKHLTFGKNEYEHEFIKKIIKVVTDMPNMITRDPSHDAAGLEPQMPEVRTHLDLGLGSNDGAGAVGIHGTGEIGEASMSSSSFSYRYAYDVFLSFRGIDTRKGFTGNLFNVLKESGIRTFFDEEELKGGEEITPTLVKAIQESRIAIPIFSENYATSSFCLDELVKIMECIKGKGRLLLPVFYGVEPSNVRHQKDSYKQAMTKHEKRLKKYIVEEWKEALQRAANLSGKHFILGNNEYEHEFIKKIVKVVSEKISRVPLHVADYSVGLVSRVLDVRSLLDAQLGYDDGVCMVGIHGIGGIGKTTLAKEIYNSIADQFEGLCFLENVRENSIKHGLEHLQKMVLSKTVGENDIVLGSFNEGIRIIKERLQTKKVLLILDDVNERQQLQALAGGPEWFGSGSRVIITTQNKDLLALHGIERTYYLDGLNEKDARELFVLHAFKNAREDDPSFVHVINRAVTYAACLPLALEIIGSYLSTKNSINLWKSALDEYERIPEKRIQKALEVSFHDLGENAQSVFLDIACCFKGFSLIEVQDILSAHHGFCPRKAIEDLVDRSLIKIDNGVVRLHDLIEKMGRDIVRKEGKPGERSRLWFPEDIVQVLENNEGTRDIQMIFLDAHSSKEEVEWDGEAFKDMKNLRTLIIRNACFSEGPKHLPNSLRVIEWWGYPSHSLPADFGPKKLVIFRLPDSCLTFLNLLEMHKKFVEMKVLDFDSAKYLTKIPDLSCAPNLEELSFVNCVNLTKIDNSVGILSKLKRLNAHGCSKLRSFPPLKLKSLEELYLSYCSNLESFPEISEKMGELKWLSLQCTAIKEFPSSIRNLTGLSRLYLNDCGFLEFPSNITQLPELTYLVFCGSPNNRNEGEEKVSFMESSHKSFSVSQCRISDQTFSKLFAWFAISVRKLDLSHHDFTFLPASITGCLYLKELNFDQCHNLREIRGLPPNLETLSATNCKSLKELDLTVLPQGYRYLKRLVLDHCENLHEIRGVPFNIEFFSASNCTSLSYTCRSKLLNQKLHKEGGNMSFFFPEIRVPEWYQCRSSGSSVSFWFRNTFPAISLCIVIGALNDHRIEFCFRPKLNINGNMVNKWLMTTSAPGLKASHIFILDRKHMEFEDNVNESLREEEWNYAEICIDTYSTWGPTQIAMETGIHVFKEKNCMEDIRFINPPNNANSDLKSIASTRTSSTSNIVQVRYHATPRWRCI